MRIFFFFFCFISSRFETEVCRIRKVIVSRNKPWINIERRVLFLLYSTGQKLITSHFFESLNIFFFYIIFKSKLTLRDINDNFILIDFVKFEKNVIDFKPIE